MKKRFFSICVVFSLIFSFLAVPVSAAGNRGVDTDLDIQSALFWRDFMSSTKYNDFLEVLTSEMIGAKIILSSFNGFDGLFNYATDSMLGEVDFFQLQQFRLWLQSEFSSPFSNSSSYFDILNHNKSFIDALGSSLSSVRNLAAWNLLFPNASSVPCFEIRVDESRNVYRIKEVVTGYWVTDTYGRYAFAPVSSGSAGGYENLGYEYRAWQAITDDLAAGTISYHMLNTDALTSLASDFSGTVTPRGEYKMIRSGNSQGALCDQNGCPFATWYTADNGGSGDAALGTPQVDVATGDVNVLSDYFLNISGQLTNVLDLMYNEAEKTYTATTYNYNVTNNTYNYYTYNWTYNINHTSITYIGQSEEYNETYEFYYELPDGRSSADLTREELEQLNLTIDVVPYQRATEDTSLWSLYHFDGTTDDCSYWNYRTKFNWQTGASITYLDSGAFNGCLYLDEQKHDFTLEMPSMLGSKYVSVEFRLYQSSTPVPQNDSYISIGGSTVLRLDGSTLMNGSGTALCAMPVGTWCAIAICRNSSGQLYYYLNGVCIGQAADSTNMDNTIQFHFGRSQQTYKYLDELRVLQSYTDLNYLNRGANYTPMSVPFDSNLSLVLPVFYDSTIPFNQLVRNGNFVNTSGWYGGRGGVVSTLHNALRVTSNNPNDCPYAYRKDIDIPVGHKVFCHIGNIDWSGTSTPVTRVVVCAYADGFRDGSGIYDGAVVDKLDVIFTATGTTDKHILVIQNYSNNSVVGDFFDVSDVCLYDLTEMFGAGNEPDLETARLLFSELGYSGAGNGVAYVRDEKIVSVSVNDSGLIADQWVSVDCFENLLAQGDFRCTAPSFENLTEKTTYVGTRYLNESGASQHVKSSNINLTSYDGGVRVSNSGTSFAPNEGVSADALFVPLGASWGDYGNRGYSPGNYTFTVVFSDGTSSSVSAKLTYRNRSHFGEEFEDCVTLSNMSPVLSFDWGKIGVSDHLYYSIPGYSSLTSDLISYQVGFYIAPDAGQSVDIAYIVLEQSGSSSVSAALNSVLVDIDDDADSPVLALRTDIAITAKQIGGVRPSIPSGRGQVYAMVQSGFITSLQIFDGRAWIECDGRIWTGSRWIPYTSYNVVTLSDLYDVADASGQSGYEYIYTDVGFWAWFQKQWLDFKAWYQGFTITGSGEVTHYNTNIVEMDDEGDSNWNFDSHDYTFIELLTLLPKAGFSAGTAVLKTVGNTLANVPIALTEFTTQGNILNPFGAFKVFMIPGT